MGPKLLPLHQQCGIGEQLLLIHAPHGTAHLPILELGVLEVPAVGRCMPPNALHGVHLLQPVILWPQIVQTYNDMLKIMAAAHCVHGLQDRISGQAIDVELVNKQADMRCADRLHTKRVPHRVKRKRQKRAGWDHV